MTAPLVLTTYGAEEAKALREQRRYEIARDVLAGTASMPQGTWAEKAIDAVTAADALLAALEADRG
jgi:hypothetical protein